MIHMIRKLVWILVSIWSISLQAQTGKWIQGSLTDAKTGEAIPFAHIYVKNARQGTIANPEGRFQLYLYHPDTTVLIISTIGYQKMELPLNNFTEDYKIQLKEDLIKLAEVVILSRDYAKEMVQKSIKALPNNYPTDSERLTGFIREILSKDSLKNDPYYISEAEIEVSKTSYIKSSETGDVSIIKGRKFTSTNMDSVSFRIYAGAHLPHRFDMVMSRSAVLNESQLKNFEFDIIDTLRYEDQQLFNVSFSAKGKKEISGNLFILDTSWAIVKFNIRYEKGASFFLLEALSSLERQYLEYSGAYFLRDNAWRLSNVEYRTAFLTNDNEKVFLNSQYSTHDVSPELSPIPYPDRIQFRDYLLESVDTYSPDYWDGYTIVTPETSTQAFFDTFETTDNKKTRLEKTMAFMEKFSFQYLLYCSPVNVRSHQATYNRHGINFTSDQEAKNFNQFGLSSAFNYSLSSRWVLGWVSVASFETNRYLESRPQVQFRYNLFPNRRPLYVIPIVGYAFTNQSVRIGQVNSPGTFRESGKKIDAKELTLFSTQRRQNLVGGFALELEKSRRLSWRLGVDYYFPVKKETGIYLVEKQNSFRQKSVFVPQQTGEASVSQRHFVTRELALNFGISWRI